MLGSVHWKLAVIAGVVLGVAILSGAAAVVVAKSRPKPESEVVAQTPEPAAISPQVTPRSEPKPATPPRAADPRPVTPVEPPADTSLRMEPPQRPVFPPLTESVLKQQLLDVPELSLPGVDDVRDSQLKYAKASKERVRSERRDPAKETQIGSAMEKLLVQASAAGLPLQKGRSCILTTGDAEGLGRGAADLRWSADFVKSTGIPTLMNVDLARKKDGEVSILHAGGGKILTTHGLPQGSLRSVKEMRKLFEEIWPTRIVEVKFNVVPLIVQVLQVENEEYRLLLVEKLASLDGRPASQALAQRALFDTSAAVREAASKALKKRPYWEYRDVLLRGFEHPWSPVADHAAEVLSEINELHAVPDLVKLLDRPNPAAAFYDTEATEHKVRELVRINHMRNCCLCHAPSYDPTDWAIGRIMEPGHSIPSNYYGSRDGAFVRADITHIRPDFSVMQFVEGAHPWPEMQRFDFVVRTRPATTEEITHSKYAVADTSYPQREAVLTALRALSGRDLGAEAESWRGYAREVAKK